MRLLVDCLVVKRGQAGLRSYAEGLVAAMSARTDVTVVVLASVDAGVDWGRAAEVVEVDVGANGALQRAAWRGRHLRKVVRSTQTDAVLTVSPEWAPAGVPTAIVVHDLGPAIAPGLYGRERALRYAFTLKRSVDRASAVIADSAATKLDLVRWVGPQAERKVHVVRLAPRAVPVDIEAPPPFDPPTSFALYVGAHLPHKNVSIILDLYSRGVPGLPERLVCVGPDYSGEKAAQLAPHLGSEWLVSPGFVTAEELAGFYRHASVVLVPSLFEGFGLPVLEALQFGCPVVATRLAVFEEVAGDAPYYVDDPFSRTAWHEGICAALGRQRPARAASTWGWSDVAAATLAVVEATID